MLGPEPEPEDLGETVEDVSIKAIALLDGRLHATPADHGVMRADSQRITQALINLLQNAAEHTTPSTPVHFRTVACTNAWRFEVADEGGGLPSGSEDEVFQPFFTAKKSMGSGLNRPGHGATFWIEIPR